MIIDAHHHLWQYNERDYAWMTGETVGLRRNYLIPDLQQVMRESGVEGTVAVQARQTIEETEWLLELAEGQPSILGVVGWVPLVEPTVEMHLERFAPHPRMKAVRHMVQDEPDIDFILRDDFNRGVSLLRDHGLAYDILIFERHLPQAITFVDRHPGQIFVVDHIAKPRIKEAEISPWRERIEELARRENVYCKVSGMVTEADSANWTPETLRPYFDVVLSAFGPGRLMFGSDWPVLTLAGGYACWMTAFLSFLGGLSTSERESICRGTAIAAYGLEPPSLQSA